MGRVYVVCEGQSEGAFVKRLMAGNLALKGLELHPFVVGTSRGFKGGITRYAKLRPQLVNLLANRSFSCVTTMIDLYRLPRDFPGFSAASSIQDPIKRAVQLEQAMEQDIGNPRLIPNLTVHEFEGLLFSDVSAFSILSSPNLVGRLTEIRSRVISPEHIDEGEATAPSKRIIDCYPKYQKLTDGVQVAERTGLDKIRSECTHFNNWIERLLANCR